MEQRLCGRLAEGWCSARPPVLTHPPEADWTCDLIRIQKVRLDDQNLYFNAESSWRWCEFSAHPRVMVYADQTGAELTDMRVRGGAASPVSPCPPLCPQSSGAGAAFRDRCPLSIPGERCHCSHAVPDQQHVRLPQGGAPLSEPLPGTGAPLPPPGHHPGNPPPSPAPPCSSLLSTCLSKMLVGGSCRRMEQEYQPGEEQGEPLLLLASSRLRQPVNQLSYHTG